MRFIYGKKRNEVTRRTHRGAAREKVDHGARGAARASIDFIAAKTNYVHSDRRVYDLRVASGRAGIGCMSLRKVVRSFWPSVWAGTFSGAVLATGLCLTACAGPARARLAVAVVMVENHSGYLWQVEFVNRETTANIAAASVQLGPRERRRLALAPGGYRMRSWVAGAGEAERVSMPPGADAEVDLVQGRTYVWPLGTLLSAEAPEL
jgi:hypothetical protein